MFRRFKLQQALCLGAALIYLPAASALAPADGQSSEAQGNAAAATALPGYTAGAQVFAIRPDSVRVDAINGIVYHQQVKNGRFRQMHMDVLIPRVQSPRPAVIYFPGGGFTSANYQKFLQMRLYLAERGFVVASAEYSVVPNMYPDLVEDGRAAVRFLRAHARKLGIDPAHIGVLGDSAGGYMSQMVAAVNGEKAFDVGDFTDVSSDVQACVSLYGISDLLSIGEGLPDDIQAVHKSPAVTEALLLNGPAFNTFGGAAVDADPDKARAASPIGHVDGSEPPTLLMHGSADTLVSPMQSVHMYEALQKAGVQSEHMLLEGAGHGDDYWFEDVIYQKVASFFEQHLGKPVLNNGKAAAAAGSNL